jgi:UDP-N-acetylglucosamine kinase
MMTTVADVNDEAGWVLDEAESRRIFRERIVPDQVAGTPQDQPVVVIVGGQPGDGKATITALAQAVLLRRGRPVTLSAAAYEPYHPGFRGPIAEAPATTGLQVGVDGERWLAEAEALVIQQRYDAVLELQLFDPVAFEESARRFKAAGYQVEVAIVAVHESLSRFGVLARQLRALQIFGYGRTAEQSFHDACYEGVERAAEAVDREALVDRVAVLRPDGQLLYGNERMVDGRWQQPPWAKEAVTRERDRPWTVLESRLFLEDLSQLERTGLGAPIQWVRDEVVGGAKAIMALARPRLHPDAITLHIATAGTAVRES